VPYASNNGLRIHYTLDGTGPPLVLHHGFTGSSRDWESFGYTDVLREHYQLIMLDVRGHGRSDKPHAPTSYGFEHGVNDVVAELDELGNDQAHYYGYSYGGMMGWAIGKFAPERFASIAIGGAHPYAPGEGVWARVERMRSYLQQGMSAYVAWRESSMGPWPPAFRERVLANDPEALAALITSGLDHPDTHRFDAALDRMTMPVLVITGDDDELYAGTRSCLAAQRLPAATFIEIPNADHFTLYARSDLILPHLKTFLSRSVAGSRTDAVSV
jgi:pimeloyl-ACP methyl ester carboxylesterase